MARSDLPETLVQRERLVPLELRGHLARLGWMVMMVPSALRGMPGLLEHRGQQVRMGYRDQ
jgi:hypothetical protein